MQLNFYRIHSSKVNKAGVKAVRTTMFMVLAIIYSLPLFSQTAPSPPTAISATPSAVCQGNATSLRATSTGNTIKWYTVANGGTAIGVSASGAIFSVSPSVATTYYAESLSPSSIPSTSRAQVSVAVNTVPVLTYIPPDVNTTNSSGQCGTVVYYPQALATGTPTPTILYSNPSGQNFQVGTTTVLTTAVNTCGNSSLSFDVNVTDNEPPIVVSPPDTSIVAPSGASTLTNVDLGSPTASDNCGVITISNDAPNVFHGGTTTVTWTVTDENGQSASAVQHVTVILLTPTKSPVMGSISSNDADNTISQYSSISLNLNWADAANDAFGAPYKVDVDWRDSSAHTVLNGVTVQSASVLHTYNKTGVYAPVVIVSNSANLADTAVFKYVVVYVGGDYSTTADGNFSIPQNAITAFPNMTLNNRNVAFGVQCKPKTNVPGAFDGDLKLEMGGNHFQFETENVNWDYLAVSACYLAQFQGSGYMYPTGHKKTCKGMCHGACYPTSIHYGILVVQSDKKRNPANANMVRIKIWNKDDGSIIFDTQPGDADNALPTTSLNGLIKVNVPINCIARMDAGDASISDGKIETSVSPNPFTSVFGINVQSASTENVTLDIYDMLGKQVQHLTDLLPNQPLTIQCDFPIGLYFLHIQQGSRVQIVRIIKENK